MASVHRRRSNAPLASIAAARTGNASLSSTQLSARGSGAPLANAPPPIAIPTGPVSTKSHHRRYSTQSGSDSPASALSGAPESAANTSYQSAYAYSGASTTSSAAAASLNARPISAAVEAWRGVPAASNAVRLIAAQQFAGAADALARGKSGLVGRALAAPPITTRK